MAQAIITNHNRRLLASLAIASLTNSKLERKGIQAMSIHALYPFSGQETFYMRSIVWNNQMPSISS